jgi:hypothetical protein
MRRVTQVLVLGLTLAALAPASVQASGNANFTIGERSLGDEWGPLDGQPMLGATVDWGPDDWPVHFAWGINGSADSQDEYYGNGEISAAFAELSFGALWLPIRDKPVRPYLGAGIASVSAVYELDYYWGYARDVDDQDFGYYANAGVYWRLGPRFNLGVDLRYGWGTEFDLSFESKFEEQYRVEGDYLAFSLLLGFGWGG